MKRFILGLALLSAVVVPVTSVQAGTPSVTASARLSGALRTPDYHLAGDTVTFSVTLTNRTSVSQTLPVNFHINRVLTYEGQDVTSGYPALTLRGDAATRTTQRRVAGSEQTKIVTIAGGASKVVSFTDILDECGYFQVDTNTVTGGVKRHLAGTFVRVLGCEGVCHYNAQSDHYVFFPIPEQETAALRHLREHEKARETGNDNETHFYDYPATIEDRLHYDLHKAPGTYHKGPPQANLCVSQAPEGYPDNKYDTHV